MIIDSALRDRGLFTPLAVPATAQVARDGCGQVRRRLDAGDRRPGGNADVIVKEAADLRYGGGMFELDATVSALDVLRDAADRVLTPAAAELRPRRNPH